MRCDRPYLCISWIPFLLLCFTQLTGGAWLRCYKGSLENYLGAPLNKNLPKSFTSCLDPALPTVIYTFGYRGKSNGPATTAVLEAHIKKKKRNVILLDWEEEAKSGLLGIPLGYAFNAVPNAKKVGKEMGEALLRLRQAGLNMDSFHLVGHSLGAHIMAFAGKKTREMGLVMPRVTGLDPARALFEGPLAVQSGLDRTCARFVDIIHSDPGGYGTSFSTGTVDIWPNYSSENSPQPGCPTGDFDMFTPEELYPADDNDTIAKPSSLNIQIIRKPLKRHNLCSHDRAWRYYVEAISSPTAFPAVSAADYDNWVAQAGQTKPSIYLGDLTNTKAQGNFYLTTNSKPEFGRGPDGLKPAVVKATNASNTNSLTKLFKILR